VHKPGPRVHLAAAQAGHPVHLRGAGPLGQQRPGGGPVAGNRSPRGGPHRCELLGPILGRRTGALSGRAVARPGPTRPLRRALGLRDRCALGFVGRIAPRLDQFRGVGRFAVRPPARARPRPRVAQWAVPSAFAATLGRSTVRFGAPDPYVRLTERTLAGSPGLSTGTDVMRQEDPERGDPIDPLDWRKIVPFEAAA